MDVEREIVVMKGTGAIVRNFTLFGTFVSMLFAKPDSRGEWAIIGGAIGGLLGEYVAAKTYRSA